MVRGIVDLFLSSKAAGACGWAVQGFAFADAGFAVARPGIDVRLTARWGNASRRSCGWEGRSRIKARVRGFEKQAGGAKRWCASLAGRIPATTAGRGAGEGVTDLLRWGSVRSPKSILPAGTRALGVFCDIEQLCDGGGSIVPSHWGWRPWRGRRLGVLRRGSLYGGRLSRNARHRRTQWRSCATSSAAPTSR